MLQPDTPISLPEELSPEFLLRHIPIGIIYFNPQFEILGFNEQIYNLDLSGILDISKITGKKLKSLPVFKEDDFREIADTLQEGEPFEKIIRSFKTITDDELRLSLRLIPIIREAKFNGGILLIDDLVMPKSFQPGIFYRSPELKQLLDKLFDFFLITDPEGNVIYIPQNDFLQKMKILSGENVVALAEFFPGPAAIEIRRVFSLLKMKKESAVADLLFPLNSGDLLFETKFIAHKDSKGAIVYVLCLFTEITEKKIKEIERSKEIEHYKEYYELTNAVVDAAVSLDFKGIITGWNVNASKLFGIGTNEAVGKFIGNFITPINPRYFFKLRDEIKAKGIWESEFQLVLKGSDVHYLILRFSYFFSAKEKIMLLITDNTHRTKAEKRLKEAEKRFREIITNTSDYICTIDKELIITYANPNFENSFEHDRSLKGRKFSELISRGSTYSNYQEMLNLALRNIKNVELPLINNKGDLLILQSDFSSVKDESGEVKYFVVVLTDITLQKEAEKDLRLTETIFLTSYDGIAVDNGGEIVLVNDAFLQIFGFTRQNQALGQQINKLLGTEKSLIRDDVLSRKNAGFKERTRFLLTRTDGKRIVIERSMNSFLSEDDVLTVSILRDVTQEQTARKALADSEERYRSITENINVCIWTYERIGKRLQPTFYSPAIQKITGYDSKEFINREKLWIQIIHPDFTEEIINKTRRFYGNRDNYSGRLEYQIIDKEGNSIWVENKINVVRDVDGKVTKIFGLFSDISSIKRSEDALTQKTEDLKKLNDTKDRFISIISHDLRTPFSSIIGFTDVLLGKKPVPEEKKVEYIGYIRDSANSMLSLVNSLLEWTRLQTGRIKFEPQRIDAREVITRSINMLRGNALRKNIELVSGINKEVFVHADENLLLQVFNNLISNALKFTNEGGYVRINAYPRVEGREYEFVIEDNGVGIKDEDKGKLFKIDSKFTLEGTSGEKGTGLGLSLVTEIVNIHGGEIWVESKFGSGSKFLFTIAVSSAEIHIVDDSRTDRILYSKLLRSIMPKYHITESTNGLEALEYLQTATPAIIISDHGMPVMNGLEFVKKIMESDFRYKPPVIILSSDLTRTLTEDYRESGVDFVFTKPVNLSAFKITIEKSLKKAIF